MKTVDLAQLHGRCLKFSGWQSCQNVVPAAAQSLPWGYRHSVNISEPSLNLPHFALTHCMSMLSIMVNILAQRTSMPAFHNLNFPAFGMAYPSTQICCYLPCECWQLLSSKCMGNTTPASGMASTWKMSRDSRAHPSGVGWLLGSMIPVLSYFSSLPHREKKESALWSSKKSCPWNSEKC